MNTEKRLAEIRERKQEIRALLESDADVDLEKIEAELKGLNDEQQELERQHATAAGANAGAGNLRTITGREAPHFLRQLGGGHPAPATEKRSYEALFPELAGQRTEFRSLGDWWKAAVSDRYDERLESRSHVAGVPELGGYLVPTQYAGMIVNPALQESIILSRARVVPLDSLKVEAAAWDDLDQSTGAYYGGFKPTWIAEDSDQSENEQTAKLRQITLEANKLALYTSLTREVAFGSRPGLENELRTALGTSVRLGLDEAALLGDGNGKPAGIATDANPALVAVNRQEDGKVKYADVAAMLGRLHGSALEGAIWVANPAVFSELLTMTDDAGRIIWQPSAREGEPDRLLGKPLFWFDRMPDLGSKADLLLVNPRFYLVGLGPDVAVESSTGPHWFKDRVALRAVVLADGKGTWNAPYTPPSGATRSWAVALDVAAV